MKKIKFKFINLILAGVMFISFGLSACKDVETEPDNRLATPLNVAIEGSYLVWDEVENADDWYIVKINDALYDAYSNQYYLGSIANEGAYTFSVKAVGQGKYEDSQWSQSISHKVTLTLNTPELSLNGSNVVWKKNVDATAYDVSIKFGEEETVQSVTSNVFSLADFEDVGAYEIKVKAKGSSDLITNSEWSQSIKFNLSAISFVLNGAQVSEPNAFNPIVKPEGSIVSVPIPERTDGSVADTFTGWYTDRSFTKLFTGTTMGATELTLYAQWQTEVNSLFSYTTAGTEVTITKLKDYNKYTNNGITPTQITIPEKINGNDVVAIGDSAFANKKIESVTIPSTVKSIGSYAFSLCKSLSEVEFEPNSTLTTIKNNAFNACANLNEITIPDSVKTIGVSAFHETGIFHNATSGVVIIGEWALGFKDTLATDLAIGTATSFSDIKRIADSAFAGSAITSLTLGNDIIHLGESAFSNCLSLETVVIGNGLELIGARAFYMNTALSSITFGESIKTIGDYAFAYSTSLYVRAEGDTLADYNTKLAESLIDIVLPDSVATIGSYAFSNCAAIKSVEFGSNLETIGKYAFNYCQRLATISFEPLKSGVELEILDSAFYLTTNLGDVAFPEGTTVIGSFVFQESGITSVIFPFSLTEIKQQSFMACKKLASVEFTRDNNGNASITKLGYASFTNCQALLEIHLPASLTNDLTEQERNESEILNNFRIGYGAFSLCHNLMVYIEGVVVPTMRDAFVDVKAVFVEDNLSGFTTAANWSKYASKIYLTSQIVNNEVIVPTIDNKGQRLALYTGNAEEYTVNSNITEISVRAFALNKTLKKLTIPNSVTLIGMNAFNSCPNLEEVIIQDGTGTNGLKTIESGAFQNCVNLKSVDFGNTIVSIGANSFYECYALEKIILPDSVLSIGQFAFSKCTSATKIELGNGVRTIADYAFSSVLSLAKIDMPESLETIGAMIFDASRPVVFFYSDRVPELDGNGWGDGIKALIIVCDEDDAGNIINTRAQKYKDKWKTSEHKIHTQASLRQVAGKDAYIVSELDGVTALIAYFGDADTFVVPRDIKTIVAYAFTGCASLKTLYIGTNVTTVQILTFSGWDDSLTINMEYASASELPTYSYIAYPKGFHPIWYYPVSRDLTETETAPIVNYDVAYPNS